MRLRPAPNSLPGRILDDEWLLNDEFLGTARRLRRGRLPRRAASASNAGSGVSSSSFEVTTAHIAKGEVAREWVADVFENVDLTKLTLKI